MKCRECGAEMRLDDKDFNFKGNYDNYWDCDYCKTSCVEQIRYGKPYRESWHTEKDNKEINYTILR